MVNTVKLNEWKSSVGCFLIAEVELKQLPVDFDGSVKSCMSSLSEKQELINSMERDFPGCDCTLANIGEYKVLMKLSGIHLQCQNFGDTLLSLLRLSTKTMAYVIDPKSSEKECLTQTLRADDIPVRVDTEGYCSRPSFTDPGRYARYLFGEAVMDSLPIEYNGKVENFSTTEALEKSIKKEFPEYNGSFTKEGVYRIFIEIPKSFILNERPNITFTDLMKASIKKRAYILTQSPINFEREFISDFNITSGKEVSVHFREIEERGVASDEIYKTVDFTCECTKGEVEESKLKALFGTLYEANKNNPEVLNRLRELSSKSDK